MASGRPVIAYGRGGALDTVIEGKTGLLFEEQSVEGLVQAVKGFEALSPETFLSQDLQAHAQSFSRRAFRKNMVAIVEQDNTLEPNMAALK